MKEAPRVLLVAEHASAKFGGEAALALHYYRVLRARKIPVWLVVHERTRGELSALFPDDAHRILFVADTIWHRTLWHISKPLPARLANFSIGFIMRILSQVAQRRVIKRLVRDERITVIHQPMPVSPKEPSLIYGMGVPVIIGPMNGGMNYPPAFREMQGPLGHFLLWLGRRLANWMNWLVPGKRKAALLLVANERTKMALPSCVLGNRIEMLVENGVDMSLWQESTNDPGVVEQELTRYVFVGRLIKLKAIDLLFLAFKRACIDTPMSLSIIGDGMERARLEQLADSLNLLGDADTPGKVHFVGWLSQAACAAQMQHADVLVLPSLMECGGAVVLEAMAMSMPAIATNWGGPADYLDATCGILVDPTSRELFVENLVFALKTMAESREKRVAMGLAGREKIMKHFDWEMKVNRMLEIYESVQKQPSS